MFPTLCLSFSLALPPVAPTQDAHLDAHGVDWGAWYVLLPFDHPEGSTSVAKVHGPEKELKSYRLDAEGPDLERKWKAKGGEQVLWQLARASQPAGPDWAKLDFTQLVPDAYVDKGAATTNNAVAYAWRTLTSPRAIQLSASFGSDDGCRIWLNGKLIHDKDVARGVNPNDDKLLLALKAGVNHVLVKVNNGGGAWGAQLTGPPQGEPEAPETPQQAINAAIDRGIIYLLTRQNLDGSWSYDQNKYRNGQTALALYALMKSGLREDHPAVRRGLEFLRTHPPRRTYSMACQILALVSTHSDRHQGWIEDCARELEDWQEGGFGYPEGENDLSNTQYGALGLYAAMKAGVDVPDRVWLYLLRNALNHQNGDGGFGYRIGAKTTGSMTVAGLTIIGICREGFGDSGFPSQLEKKAERAMEEGMGWLGDNFRSDKNPGEGAQGGADERWKHYYLYGLERLAALLRIDTIGEYDWYRQGAHFYVKHQGDKGNWGTAYGEDEPNTCFGLLFLSRGTASLTGVTNYSPTERLYATDGPEAEVVLRAKGDTPLDLWLSEFPAATIEKHGREVKGGKKLFIEQVEYLADGVSVATVAADGRLPWNREPLATQHHFTTRGAHTVQLKVHLARDPDASGAAPVVISSPVLSVRVDQILEDWMLDYPDDNLSNLALDEKKTVKASSSRDGNKPDMATDGMFSTAWACKKDDKAPSLTIDFRRPILADRVLLSHPTSREASRGQYDRATRVALDFGAKREAIEYDLDPSDERKSVLELPRKMKVRELTIRVLAREKGKEHAGCVGFAEVELRLGEE